MTLNEKDQKDIEQVEESLPRFMTLEEAALRVGVSKRTLTRYAKDKDNPFPIVYFSDHTARVPWDQFNLWIDSMVEKNEKV